MALVLMTSWSRIINVTDPWTPGAVRNSSQFPVICDGTSALDLGPTVARGLYELFVEANYEVPPDLREIGRLDDAFSLAEQGTYGTTEAFTDLLAFAAQFEHAR